MAKCITFERYSPFRTPRWRLESVMASVSGRSLRSDDHYIRAYRKFRERYQNSDGEARDALGYENPGLFWAHQLYESRTTDRSSRKSAMIECRILAGLNDTDIAAQLFTVPEVIEWYSALFYDVRERLSAHDWIIDQVLIPAFVEQTAAKLAKGNNVTVDIVDPYFDATIKFFAYFGGPAVLDFIFSGFQRTDGQQLSAAGVGAWFDDYFAGRCRQRSAQAMSSFGLNRYNVMELFQLHVTLMQIAKSKKDPDEKTGNMFNLMKGLINATTWAVGDTGMKKIAGTPMEKYDNSAAELRDNEVQMVANGTETEQLLAVTAMSMPAAQPLSQEIFNVDTK